MQHQRKCASDVFFQTMTGTSSSVGTLFVWFPAAWMPLVVGSNPLEDGQVG